MATATDIKHSGGWLVALGAVTILAGMVAVALPLAAGVTFAWFVGVVLLVVGILQFVGAWRARAWGGQTADLVGGVLYVVAGILAVAFPMAMLAVLALAIAIFLMLRGAYQTWAALRIKPARGWGWLLFGGVLALVLGLLLLLGWPDKTVWVIGLFVGIELIFTGWTYAFLGVGIRGIGSEMEDAAAGGDGDSGSA
jgi:uncharacterized membrane protein HdeD (DUF308 family)